MTDSRWSTFRSVLADVRAACSCMAVQCYTRHTRPAFCEEPLSDIWAFFHSSTRPVWSRDQSQECYSAAGAADAPLILSICCICASMRSMSDSEAATKDFRLARASSLAVVRSAVTMASILVANNLLAEPCVVASSVRKPVGSGSSPAASSVAALSEIACICLSSSSSEFSVSTVFRERCVS